jgi:hypothetical protein
LLGFRGGAACFAVTINLAYTYGLFGLSMICYVVLWKVRAAKR